MVVVVLGSLSLYRDVDSPWRLFDTSRWDVQMYIYMGLDSLMAYELIMSAKGRIRFNLFFSLLSEPQ